jgi:TRAP-type mannitol/chloroaromatic compound transport system substrate-binding protein
MTFLKKLANRTKEVAEQAAKAASTAYDEMTVSDDVREERYDLCKACEYYYSVTTTCKKCGCFMSAKTYLAAAECPTGRWKPVIILKREL